MLNKSVQQLKKKYVKLSNCFCSLCYFHFSSSSLIQLAFRSQCICLCKVNGICTSTLNTAFTYLSVLFYNSFCSHPQYFLTNFSSSSSSSCLFFSFRVIFGVSFLFSPLLWNSSLLSLFSKLCGGYDVTILFICSCWQSRVYQILYIRNNEHFKYGGYYFG